MRLKMFSPTVKLDASQLGGMAISPDRVSDQFKGGAHNGKRQIFLVQKSMLMMVLQLVVELKQVQKR